MVGVQLNDEMSSGSLSLACSCQVVSSRIRARKASWHAGRFLGGCDGSHDYKDHALSSKLLLSLQIAK